MCDCVSCEPVNIIGDKQSPACRTWGGEVIRSEEMAWSGGVKGRVNLVVKKGVRKTGVSRRRNKNKNKRRRRKKGVGGVHSEGIEDDSEEKWRIGAWNARGLVPKLDRLTEFCEENSIDLVLVADTQEDHDAKCMPGWRFTVGVESRYEKARRPTRGIGIVSKRSVNIIRKSEHSVWFVEPHQPDVLYHGAYWPNDTKENARAVDKFARDYLQLGGQEKTVYSFGDYNCRMATFGDEVINTNGRHLMAVGDGLALKRPEELGHDGVGFTRVEHRRLASGRMQVQESSPDGFMTNDDGMQNVLALEIAEEDFTSDHRMIIATLLRKKQKARNGEGDRSKSWNRARLKSIGKYLNEAMGEKAESSNVVSLNDEFRSVIEVSRETAERVLGWQCGVQKQRRRKRSVVIKQAERRLRKAEKMWETDRTQRASRRLILRKRQLSELMVSKSNEKRDGEKERMEVLQDAKDVCGLWDATNKCLRSTRKSVLIPERMLGLDGLMKTKPKEVMEALGDGFRNVSKAQLGNAETNFWFDAKFKDEIEKVIAGIETNREIDKGPLDGIFTQEEYLRAVWKTKDGKAAGPYGILPEFMKHACRELHEGTRGGRKARDEAPAAKDQIVSPFADRMMLLYNRCLSEEEYPEVLKVGEIRALFKSGETQLTKNYRPITLLSYVAKNLGSMIDWRIQKHLEETGGLAEEQGGFRKGRSQVQQIATLLSVIKDRKVRGRNTAVIFLDVNKAYDQMWRKGLLYKLRQKGVTGKMWGLIKNSLENVKRRMKVPGYDFGEMKMFETEEGVTQGAPESPVLYSVFINDLVECLRAKGIGVRVVGKLRPALLFADDIAIMVDTVEEIHRALRIVTEYARKWRFSFNGKKSAVMAWGSRGFRDRVKEQGFTCTNSMVPVKSEYKYLGVIVTENLRWNRQVEKMIASCNARTNSLIWRLTNGRRVRPRTAIYVWNAMVRPVLEYASEIWAHELSEDQETRIEKIQRRFVRKMCQLPGGTPTAFIKLEYGVERMRARWDKLTIRFLEKVVVMDKERLTRQALSLRMRNCRQGCWWVKVKEMLAVSRFDGVLSQINGMDDLQQLMEAVVFDVDRRECDKLKEEVSQRSSLTEYHQIKCWETISSDRAYAKTHIGRQAARFHEPYLDEWPADKKGTRLKTLIRSGQLLLYGTQMRRKRLRGILSWCVCCNDKKEENMHHFLMECPAYAGERSRRDQRVARVLLAAQNGRQPGNSMHPGEFDALSSYERMLRILGKRMKLVKIDEALDRACRKYLVKAWDKRAVIQKEWVLCGGDL